ncbi:MAG TPA: winged helix-turn-helix domain-containing protein, partial [Planctomycetota bacterium]|nr:winged helix-turn-helix domain-containing protein [Planctomycetota bacterium]
MLYRFDDFELDADHYELRHRGQPRHVEPQVFDLLAFLCRNPDRVVTREELVAGVWQGRTISDAT